MFNCENYCSWGTNRPKGPTGGGCNNGKKWSNGLFGGWSDKWNFNDGNTAFPASGQIRLDTADPSTATHIYINKTDANSLNVHSFLDSFDNNGKYGWIRLFKEYDSTIFSYHKIIGMSIVGDVYDFTVDSSATDKSTAYVNNINMVVSFTPRHKENNTLDYSFATGGETPYIIITGTNPAALCCYLIYEGNTYHGSKIKDITVLYKNSIANSMIISVNDVTNTLNLAYGTVATAGANPVLLTLTKANDSSVARSIISVNILNTGEISTAIHLYGISITFE